MSSRTSSFRVQFEVDGDGKVSAVFGDLAQRSEQARKSAENVGRELLQVADRVDKTGSRTRQYARDLAVLDAAQKAGLISQKEHANLLKQVKDDLTATDWKRYQAGAAAAGAVIGTAMVSVLALTIRNTIQAQQELAQLDAILQSTGGAAGYSRDQLLGMADGLAAFSTFSSGEIVEAQTRLLSYSGVLGENIPRAMQSVIDQSARLGISVTQSAETIGRALESPAKAAAALAQQGFGAAFTAEVRQTIDALVAAGQEGDAQRMILDILEESYGGAAQAARDTFGGALTALKNVLNDVTTGSDGSLDGARLAVEDLISTLNDPAVRDGFQNIVGGMLQVINVAGKFVGAISTRRQLFGLMDGSLAPADAGDSALEERQSLISAQLSSLDLARRGSNVQQRQQYGALLNRALLQRGPTFGEFTIDGQERVLREEQSRLQAEQARRQRTAANTTVDPRFTSVTGGANRPRNAGSELVNPELQKEIDAVKQQAAAYGLSRTALAELNREKALAAATNDAERAAINSSYDALVKRIGADEASTKGAQVAKRARDEQRRAEEQLTQLFERTTAAYREQAALQYDASEAARTRYSIDNGALAAMSEPRQREILQLAEARDAQQRLDAVRREGLALSESLYSPLERMRALQDEYTAALARGAIDQETWNQLIAQSRAELDEAEQAARRNFPSMKMLMEDFAEGTQIRLGDDLYDAFSGNTDRIADRWKSLLLQMTADLIASGLMEAVGGKGGSASGGIWGTIASAIGGWLGGSAAGTGAASGTNVMTSKSGTYTKPGRATGGYAGEIVEVNEQGMPELFRQGTKTFLMPGAGGVVVPARAAAAPGMAAGASGPPVVNLHVTRDATEDRSEVTQGPGGQINIKLWLKREVQSAFASGEMDKTMSGLYGVRRQGAAHG